MLYTLYTRLGADGGVHEEAVGVNPEEVLRLAVPAPRPALEEVGLPTPPHHPPTTTPPQSPIPRS